MTIYTSIIGHQLLSNLTIYWYYHISVIFFSWWANRPLIPTNCFWIKSKLNSMQLQRHIFCSNIAFVNYKAFYSCTDLMIYFWSFNVGHLTLKLPDCTLVPLFEILEPIMLHHSKCLPATGWLVCLPSCGSRENRKRPDEDSGW